MTHKIEITVPDQHHSDPTCPHCHEPLGQHLEGVYPESDPHALGGERNCPHCDGRIRVSVYRPQPTFAVAANDWWPENVTHIRR